ncbi:MAG: cobalamin-dependent protein [Candidatus Saganbacteria bacterium]|nr:cobalamin-dependent protein [Candidatus Saganbacteria bacterium]
MAYISSYLKKAGKSVDCLDLNHSEEPVAQILQSCFRKKRYSIICCGGLSIYYHQIKELVELSRKYCPGAKIVLGGALVSCEPELMLDSLRPDYIVIGEGEQTILDLIDHLENKQPVETVKGLAFRNSHGKCMLSLPRPRLTDLDALPIPDYEAFGYEQYLDNMHPSDIEFYDIFDHPRVHSIVGSRDCPFRCTFCYHVLGGKYTQRSIKSIMDELEYVVKKYRINVISFYDQLFAKDPERVLELCSKIKPFLNSLPWDCRWFVAGLRVPDISDHLIKAMIDAGCFMISFGLESYSIDILKSYKKRTTPEQIERAVRTTFNNRISLWANFVFFDIAETKHTAQITLDYWIKNSQIGLELTHLRPFPGTAIYKHCLAKGTIKDKLKFVADASQQCFNTSDQLTEEEFNEVRHRIAEAWALHRKYAVPESLQRSSDGTICFTIECPHCKSSIKYSNYLYIWPGMKIYCRRCRKTFFMISTRRKLISLSLLCIIAKIVPGRLWQYWNGLTREYLRKTFDYDDDKIEILSDE